MLCTPQPRVASYSQCLSFSASLQANSRDLNTPLQANDSDFHVPLQANDSDFHVPLQAKNTDLKLKRCIQRPLFRRFLFSHTGGTLNITNMPNLNVKFAQGFTDKSGVHHSFMTTHKMKRVHVISDIIDEYNQGVDDKSNIKLMPVAEPIITFPHGGTSHNNHVVYNLIMRAKHNDDPSYWFLTTVGDMRYPFAQPSISSSSPVAIPSENSTSPVPTLSIEDVSQNEEEYTTTKKRKRSSGDFLTMCREFMAEQDALKEENRKLQAIVLAKDAAAAETVKEMESLKEENTNLAQSLASARQEITGLAAKQRTADALKDSVASVMTAWLTIVNSDAP